VDLNRVREWGNVSRFSSSDADRDPRQDVVGEAAKRLLAQWCEK
jgi:hypothetical protein